MLPNPWLQLVAICLLPARLFVIFLHFLERLQQFCDASVAVGTLVAPQQRVCAPACCQRRDTVQSRAQRLERDREGVLLSDRAAVATR